MGRQWRTELNCPGVVVEQNPAILRVFVQFSHEIQFGPHNHSSADRDASRPCLLWLHGTIRRATCDGPYFTSAWTSALKRTDAGPLRLSPTPSPYATRTSRAQHAEHPLLLH
jgi:hypothetical protein